MIAVCRDFLPASVGDRLWPDTGMVITTATATYRYFTVVGTVADEDLVDPTDGAVLVSVRVFRTIEEAERWVAGDRLERES